MLKAKLFSPVLFILLLLSLFVYNGCQQQEERNYTDAELKTIVDNLTQVWNGGDLTVIGTTYTENCIRHNADINVATGPEEITAYVEWIYKAYPDFKVTFGEPMKLKDRVVITWSATGTNEGPVDDIVPATGKKVSFTGISVIQIENGKSAEEWVYYNQLPIYSQMGFKFVLVEEEGD